MPAEPAPLSPSFAAPRARARLGRGDAIVLALLAALAILVLAAWQIPPMLDWSRFRGAIATTASARLGRPVSIEGQVRLSLLPRPMLMADHVSLPDRGDGLSARIGTLRLEVALSSLLAGHVVPRALSLDDPQVSLPWPPPRGTRAHLPARAAGEFAATITGGTLAIGGMTLHDVTASLRTDPDTGSFAAQGNARAAGLPWRFTALLGAAGTDGISPVNLTLDGRAAPRAAGVADMQGTGGAFHGRLLADGTVLGTMVLRGPDLSRLGAGPALAWQVQGGISASAQGLRAPALDLRLADSPGKASLAWDLAAQTALSVRASVGRLPAGAWMWRALQRAPLAGLTAELDLSADAVQAPGGPLQSVHVRASLGAAGASVHAASAILSGGTRVEASGDIRPRSSLFTGPVHVSGTALHGTLRWLGWQEADRLPSTLLNSTDLRASLTATPGRLDFSSLHGSLDGGQVTGSVAVGMDGRPELTIALATDRLPLAAWSGWPWLQTLPSASLLHAVSGADATVSLRAGQIAWPGLPMRNAGLQAGFTRAGLAVSRLALDLPGGHVEASGSLGSDGRLTGGHFDLAAQDAAQLPPVWRVAPALWQGGFHLALTGAGPPGDISAQLRADLGDLRAEAEAHIDAAAPRMAATVTLRHPGAPRLLAALGVPGARAWLDDGSFAWLGHLIVSPGHVQARDFSLSAGALQIGGRLNAAFLPAGLRLAGTIDAPSLALPAWPAVWDAPLAWGWLHGVDGNIGIRAARVLSGLVPMATEASATLLMGSGVAMLQDGHARLGAGQVAGEFAVDSTQDPPAASLIATARDIAMGTLPPDSAAPPGVALRGGTIDLALDLHGHSTSQVAGTVQADIRGTSLAGIDLAAASAVLRQGGAGLRDRLYRALASGQSAPMEGSFAAAFGGGVATLTPARLFGPAGAIDLGGTIDLDQRTMNLRLLAIPALPVPPKLPIGLVGTWAAARVVADLNPGLAWAGVAPKFHARGRRHFSKLMTGGLGGMAHSPQP